MAIASSPELLALHGVRIKGASEPLVIALRFGLDTHTVSELLLDYEAYGMVSKTDFAGRRVWSLTPRGKAENIRQLAEERRLTASEPILTRALAAFDLLNAEFLEAATDWQLQRFPDGMRVPNTHDDHHWDDTVLRRISRAGAELATLTIPLAAHLVRFEGYPERFLSSLRRVELGDSAWMDDPGLDSCHLIWMELHEDLLASLGAERGPT